MKTARGSNLGAGVRKSAEERREEILEAAIEEFAARGLRGASIESVAERVGVSQPYVYKLFGTKKDLFLAASHDEDVREAVGEGYAGLWCFVKGISGASDEEVRNFFAMGMLMTVDAAIGLTEKLGKQVGIGDQMGEE